MNDLDCDWICDQCGAYMNDQPGFSAGGEWTCAVCGSHNDVSEGNIVELDSDDGYVGSYQYYVDEDIRQKDEEEQLWELGIHD